MREVRGTRQSAWTEILPHWAPVCIFNEVRPLAFRSDLILQDEHDVLFNPLLKLANGKQDAFPLAPSAVPILVEASGQCLFLLGWLEFGQQQSMAYANLIFGKRLDDFRREFSKLDSLRDVAGRLAHFRGDLLDGVFRLFQIEQGAEALNYASYCTSMLAQCRFVAAHFPRRYLRSELSNGESGSGGS